MHSDNSIVWHLVNFITQTVLHSLQLCKVGGLRWGHLDEHLALLCRAKLVRHHHHSWFDGAVVIDVDAAWSHRSGARLSHLEIRVLH